MNSENKPKCAESIAEIKAITVPKTDWASESIRIATYNIQYPILNWPERCITTAELIKDYKFDVFGAQEPHLTQIEDMMEHIGDMSAISATAGDNAESTYKNVFTIAISDDFTKGTYKVTNMFKAALYYNNGMITDKGGEYYANYKDGKFVVLSDNAVKSYGFTTDVTLAYDEVNMAFAAEKPIAAYDYSKNRDRFIGGYAAVVKVEEPEVGADPIAGEWDVTVQFAPAFGGDYAEKTGTMVISGSNGSYVIETIAGETFNLTATFANNTLTASKNGATLTLTYDAAVGTLTQDSKEFQTWELPTMKSLVATKQGGATPEVPVEPSVNIAGTWNQSVVGMSWPAPSATMTIAVDGSSVTLTDFVAAGTVVTATFENNQIVVPKGTMIGSGSSIAGPLDADVVLTLEGNTFTAAPFSIGGYMNITSYSATNPDMEVGGGEEPEPEVPADPWENAASFTNDGTGYGAFMKELKVYADATNMYVRLTVEKQTAYCTDAFGPLGNYLDIVLADGEGELAVLVEQDVATFESGF